MMKFDLTCVAFDVLFLEFCFDVMFIGDVFLVGVDPKSILCEFFKAGQCQKGFKCKFSHDLNIQRKGEKASIYSDQRDEGIKSQSALYFNHFGLFNDCLMFGFIYL